MNFNRFSHPMTLHFIMSVSKPKCQHTDQTIKEKIEILGRLDCGVKAVDLCKQFYLCQSTLFTWKKQRCKLNEMVDAGKKEIVNHFCHKWRGPCRGITRIHRSPSRPRHSVRPTADLINIHEHLIKGLVQASC